MSTKKLELEGKSISLSKMSELISKMLIGTFIEQEEGYMTRENSMFVADGMAMVLAACYLKTTGNGDYEETMVQAREHVAKLAQDLAVDVSLALAKEKGDL